MMNWLDDLCVISGLKPDKGPVYLFRALKPCLNMIIEDIKSQNLGLDLDERQLRREIETVLRRCNKSSGEAFYKDTAEGASEEEDYCREDYGSGHREALVIGTFDQDGYGLSINGEGGICKPPSGSVSQLHPNSSNI
jgi:hypothetical protein